MPQEEEQETIIGGPSMECLSDDGLIDEEHSSNEEESSNDYPQNAEPSDEEPSIVEPAIIEPSIIEPLIVEPNEGLPYRRVELDAYDDDQVVKLWMHVYNLHPDPYVRAIANSWLHHHAGHTCRDCILHFESTGEEFSPLCFYYFSDYRGDTLDLSMV